MNNVRSVMRSYRYPLCFLIIAAVMAFLALIAESVYFSSFEYRFKTKMFNKKLIAKETIMEDCLNEMKPVLAKANHHGSVTENNIFSVAAQNEITILEYLDNKLIFWSDNDFEVPSVYVDSLFHKPLIFLQNGWFMPETIEAGNEKVIGLLRIHTDYSFENNIIKSGFEKGFKMPGNVTLDTDKKASGYHITNKNGEFLFSLVFPAVKVKSDFIIIPLCLWTFTFILIILFTFSMVRLFLRKGSNITGLIFAFSIFAVLYLVLLLSHRPLTIFQTELFSPYRFSLDKAIPSLGHLLVLGMIASSYSAIVFRLLTIKRRTKNSDRKDLLVFTGLLTIGTLIMSLYQWIFSELLSTSNINFETYKVLELNIFSMVGFVSVFLLILVPVLYLLKLFRAFRYLSFASVIYPALISSVVFIIFFYHHPGTLVALMLFYMFLVISLWFAAGRNLGLFNMTIVFSVIAGLYFLYFIEVLSEEKITENIKIQAVSLSTENDPEAEHLLLDIWPQMEQDSVLAGMMKFRDLNKDTVDKVTNYLHDEYFTGFWKNYYFNIYLCRNDQSLQMAAGNVKSQNCFGFFDDRIKRDGHKLDGTNFYFLDNQGGRSYYLGCLYFRSRGNTTNGLFIELYSDINIFQPGYSELLLDKKYLGYSGLKDYSFAKYLNGDLVLRTGDFPYDKSDAEYVGKITDYSIFRSEGFKHVVYKNGNSTVIISRPGLTAGDLIISFAYLFAFLLIFSNLAVLIIRKPDFKSMNFFNFRQKLQLSYILILLFSFILIGIVAAYISISQFQSKHYETIKEKLNSVYLELDSRLSMEKHLSPDWRSQSDASLNELLIKLSNIFNTDINLYDLYGYLIATSRPEIFSRDLTSRRIDNIAYINLKDLTRSEFYQNEKVGNLNYLSAYVPFFNMDNKVIAYLNLPYFRMQSVLAKEISNLIVVVINFTLLLIVITMSLAVFISGRLTSPLSMLSEGLASVGFGKKSEHLTYNGNDEIGEMVKKYNRMLDEIEDSATKLANSEREYAWREMAKQIAHEIKNPLTPMKLNVQQLFKSWNDKVPGFDKLIERFTRNQIEYIDNLSSIATAFSSFAKMPVTNPSRVNILDQIRLSLELFKNSDNITFRVHLPKGKNVLVYIDKEQLNGILSNLIKNAIQSIPSGREGIITLEMDLNQNNVIVSVSDNGSGIPIELRKNLFTPNFTTKSSGMGLGLSIAKKYVENANGRIWFESENNKGSVFYFELPVIDPDDNKENGN